MAKHMQEVVDYRDDLSHHYFSQDLNHTGGESVVRFNKKTGSITEDDFLTLQSYFREIGNEELLSAKDEIVYSVKIKVAEIKLISIAKRIQNLIKNNNSNSNKQNQKTPFGGF